MKQRLSSNICFKDFKKKKKCKKLITYNDKKEYFNECGKDIKILNKGQTIIKYKNNNDWNNTSYGNNWINSKSNLLVQWKFQINKISVEKQDDKPIAKNRIMLGLVSKMNRADDESFYEDDDQPYYSISNTSTLFTADNKNKKYKEIDNEELGEWKDDDIITLKLNTKKKKISLQQNGKEYDLVVDISKKKNLKYKLAISLLEVNQKITLLKCIQKKLNSR